MKLIFTLLDGEVLEFSTDKDSITVGRSSSCDVVIPRDGISRKHLSIEVREDEVYVTDLGSLNGVFIEHNKIQPHISTPYQIFLNLSFGAVSSLLLELERNQLNESIPVRSSTPRPAEGTKQSMARPSTTTRPKDNRLEAITVKALTVLLFILTVVYFLTRESTGH